MRQIKTVEYTLPSHLACALIYGDESNLDDDECAQLDAWVSEKLEEHGGLFYCIDAIDTGFCWSHDYNNLGADCAVFTFVVNEV